MQIVDLMALRVKKQGRLDFKAIQMTAEQITARRAALRQWLMKSRFANLPNDTLDAVRFWKLAAGGYILEDAGGYEYYLSEVSERRERSRQQEKGRTMANRRFYWMKLPSDYFGS